MEISAGMEYIGSPYFTSVSTVFIFDTWFEFIGYY